jgi:hypothetical protein
VEKPWEIVSEAPVIEDKKEFKAWCLGLATKHHFLSGFSGITPQIRVSYESNNAPFKMSALIVDYDAATTEDRLLDLVANPVTEFVPAYAVITHSGYARLVWLFEADILLAAKAQIKEFLVQLSRRLALNKWLAGMDTGALSDPCRYYELGSKWIPLTPDYRIPASFLQLWLLEASSKINLDEGYSENKIPMEDIAEAVEAKYPGRWSGPFEEGRRGVRFWDLLAADKTGAVIMRNGVMAFSGEQAFMPWRTLLGDSFVNKYKADRTADVRTRVVFDGRDYWWRETDEGSWKTLDNTSLTRHLKVAGFESRAMKRETSSEIERILDDVTFNCRVEKAMPFIHYPQGVITYDGNKFLNTATAKCMEPARDASVQTIGEAQKQIPFIWSLLKALFYDKGLGEGQEYTQVYYLLAWLKRFYLGGLCHAPTQGQAVVVIGPVSIGKSLFTNAIIAPLVGGYSDATPYFIDDVTWTATLMNKPLMTIDDSKPVMSHAALIKFSASLKKVVANTRMIYNEKYKQTGEAPWFGRVIVLANADSNSLQIIPDMDMSNKDKLMLFKCSGTKLDFPERAEIDRTLSQELPVFARFLELWEPPESIMSGDRRFGVKAFHHHELFGEAMIAGAGGVLHEILYDFLAAYREQHPKDKSWEGTATTLYNDLSVFNNSSMRDFTQRGMATALGGLAGKQGYNIKHRLEGKTRRKLWTIAFDMIEDTENKKE